MRIALKDVTDGPADALLMILWLILCFAVTVTAPLLDRLRGSAEPATIR